MRKVKKGIFVDGASLYYMQRSLGIYSIDFVALLKIFRQSLGSNVRASSTTAVITLSPTTSAFLAKSARVAGFEVLICETKNSKDDLALIERVRAFESAEPSGGVEIVFVSNDQDFVPVLREKKIGGAKVYIVGTKVLNEAHQSTIGQALLNVCDEGEFTFIDLSSYRALISLRGTPPSKETYFSIRIDGNERHPDRQSEIETAVRELVGRFPGLWFTRLR